MRKMRKQIVGRFNPWNFDAEVGDRVIDFGDNVYDLRESRGRNKAALGELTPVLVKTNKKAVNIDGVWYWKDV